MKKCYITTPIYYPNAKPHLGSAYTTISADFAARLYRELGYDVFFLTGTDEHGEKLAKTAEEKGKSPKEFVDEMAMAYKKAWEELSISYDRFIRTTDEDHKKLVREILQYVYDKGEIYKGRYEGQYCVGCERYYTEKELIDGKCPYHLREVENKSIEAYFFKLSSYKERLLSYYSSNPSFLPQKYKEQILNNIKELKDLCISRPKEQVSWGIPLPFDEGHVAYVWFDALLNYLSGAPNEFWPPDLQIMGKDIIWFHCVIWPAMLMASDKELPRRELAHGFLTVDGKKMSKSLGNVVDPLDVAKKYGSDALRYYLITKVPFGDDGDFSWDLFRSSYSNELIGHYGNLANRIIKLSKRCGCSHGEYPRKENLISLKNRLVELAEDYELENIMRFYAEDVWKEITEVNAYLNEKEPWRNPEEGSSVVGACSSAFVYLSVLLKPLLPEGTSKILSAYGEKSSINEASLRECIPNVESLIIYKKVDEG